MRRLYEMIEEYYEVINGLERFSYDISDLNKEMKKVADMCWDEREEEFRIFAKRMIKSVDKFYEVEKMTVKEIEEMKKRIKKIEEMERLIEEMK